MKGEGLSMTFLEEENRASSSLLACASFLFADWRTSVILVSTLFNGMAAGMMFIFSNTIMPALSKLPDETGITVMVTINDVILNPLFQILFVGGLTSVVPAIDMAFIHRKDYSKPARFFVMASTLIYFFGQIVVTASQNIPRNDILLSMDASSQAASDYWRSEYLGAWVSWNTARAIFSSIAALCGGMSLLFLGRGKK